MMKVALRSLLAIAVVASAPGCAGEGASELAYATTTAVYARNLSELELDLSWTTYPGATGTTRLDAGATGFMFDTGIFVEHPNELVESISVYRGDTGAPVILELDLDAADWTRSGSEPYQAFTLTVRDRDLEL